MFVKSINFSIKCSITAVLVIMNIKICYYGIGGLVSLLILLYYGKEANGYALTTSVVANVITVQPFVNCSYITSVNSMSHNT